MRWGRGEKRGISWKQKRFVHQQNALEGKTRGACFRACADVVDIRRCRGQACGKPKGLQWRKRHTHLNFTFQPRSYDSSTEHA